MAFWSPASVALSSHRPRRSTTRPASARSRSGWSQAITRSFTWSASRIEDAVYPENQVRLAHMAEVLLFHHALGLTSGCVSFADRLRDAGPVVHAPDLCHG